MFLVYFVTLFYIIGHHCLPRNVILKVEKLYFGEIVGLKDLDPLDLCMLIPKKKV